MRNLNLCNLSINKLDIEENVGHNYCYGYCENSTDGEVFCCSNNLILSCFDKEFDRKWVTDISAKASPNNSVVNVTLITFNGNVCVGLSNGEIFVISDNGGNCEVVGVCDGGIQAMEWSPEQEVVVVITNDNKMILMSYLFDPLHEVLLLDEQFGEGQFVTVGWGKKETQFHGSEGKGAAKVKVEVVADLNAKTESSKITWREEGDLYAVGFTMEGIRRFKVFDREGHLQYTSEKQPGLESNLSWRPSGNVIATTQKLKDKYVLAFFEKNGLKHGGFDIPGNVTVEDITWSSDSEIIALQCVDNFNRTQKVLLYTTGNYHWYLKQTVVIKDTIDKIIWDNDFNVVNNKKLHIISKNGVIHSYTWIWDVHHSVGRGDNDNAVVAVIDSPKILLTGFRQTVVPPPMAALEIDVEEHVNEINFFKGVSNSEVDSNTFFVITETNKLIFFKLANKVPLEYEKYAEGIIDNFEPLLSYNWLWLNEEIVICVLHEIRNYNLIEFQLEITDKTCKLNLRNKTLVADPVMRLQTHPSDKNKAILHTNNGDIIEYSCIEGINPLDVKLPVFCHKLNVIDLGSNLIFIGLSNKGNLYFNEDLIMNNVNSYFIHTHFILITTLEHVILCAELNKIGIEGIRTHKITESPNVYKRNVERGSKLIIAVPNDTRTVFQLPRGNLETIQPRPLSLKIIGEYLDDLKYDKAFDLMRKQRINLNLIYDHDSERFLNNCDKFLNVINVSWLNLFLADLEDIDVTQTMYSSSYSKKNKPQINKVGTLCEFIRNKINLRTDRDTKILPLLTTYVKRNTIVDLENALSIIKELKTDENGRMLKAVSSDEAIKYLLYMVDVNKLFEVALGMYDFDLVLLVASKSQKDPKEYVPMLNEFNEMEENYKKFSVNKHLKRFDRAVECLAKCGAGKYEELMTFVKYHSLYRKALEVLNPNVEIYKEIENDYALYLRLNNQLVEAGVLYSRAGNIDKAVDCYKEAVEWELAIELAHKWSKEEFLILCRNLVKALEDEERHDEALIILEQYCNNIDEAILYAIEASKFKTASRLSSQYNRSQMKGSISDAVLSELKTLQMLIKKNGKLFVEHRNRLFVVRENKSKFDEHEVGYNNDCDLYSDSGSTVASSTTSRSSSKTYRSSKNRRKHERKVASLKEGSQYEDIALVIALYGVITSTFKLRSQVRQINIALLGDRKDSEALALQTSLDKLLKEMRESMKTIWSNEFALDAVNAAIAVTNVPEGTSVVPQGLALLDPQMRVAPVIQEIKWKLEGLN